MISFEPDSELIMGIAGDKSCPNCSKKIRAIEVLKVSLGSREIACPSCGATFEFSDARKWAAIIAVIAIVFAPASPSLLLGIPFMTEGLALGIKYAVALFLFVVINGRA